MLIKTIISFGVLLTYMLKFTVAQEPVFDIPVQLVGFPVITLSVRLANFAKKLMYSLNPGTYKSITKRSYNLDKHEKKEVNKILQMKNIILNEFGKFCIEEGICKYYSEKQKLYGPAYIKNFKRIYKNINRREKSWLLSAFFGSIIRQPELCSTLQKELPCT